MQESRVTGFGKISDGRETYLYLLENENGMKVYVSDYGAALIKVLVPDQAGNLRDVVLGYDDAAAYERGTASLGATVGRNANRIGGAVVTLNGVDYQLEKNDHGKNNLHSGSDRYNHRLWETTDRAENHVTFRLYSPDGDQGFPGALEMYVTYSLDDSNMLDIHYEAVPDRDTVINMTNHSYFNLNGEGSGTVLGHTLKLDADCFTPADSESIPTGEIRSVEGTPMDFRAEKALGAQIGEDYEPLRFGGGYDHNWVLKNDGKFDKVAELRSGESGIAMEVYTDLPGVQVYTANFLSHEPGKRGAFYEKRDAVCLETQYFPDAVHHENFAQPLCRKGEKYDTHTGYRFRTEG